MIYGHFPMHPNPQTQEKDPCKLHLLQKTLKDTISYIIIPTNHFALRRPPRHCSAPPACRLLLRVEVHRRHRQPQIQLPCKKSGTKVCTRRWLVHKSQRNLLPEKHQYIPMNSDWWPWPYIWQYLLACNTKCYSTEM